MKVAIVKYPAGNVASLQFACERLGQPTFLSDDPEELQAADKVIFPGQGSAGSAMHSLREKKLHKIILNLKQPFLGICLGLQLMAEHSEENNTPTLGLFPTKVKHFEQSKTNQKLKIPHMAWNRVKLEDPHPLTDGIRPSNWFYFVHSYYMPLGDFTLGSCEYIQRFTAIAAKDNFYAVQFHPEKSGKDGEQILKNFLFGIS